MDHERGKKIGTVVILMVLLVLVVGLFLFVRHRLRYAVTNAVFVETERLAYLSFSRVGGKILEVSKEEGEGAKAGELLARLDERPYREALRAAQAELSALRHQKEALKIEIARLKKDLALNRAKTKRKLEELSAREAALSAREEALSAEIAQLQRDRERFRRLVAKNLLPKRRLEGVETSLLKAKREREALSLERKALREARAALTKELLRLENQEKLVAEKERELEGLSAREEALLARLKVARLDLSYCRLEAPFSGYVAKRFHVVGDVVGPGEPVYALVDPKSLYVLVLLEETKLKGVQVGSPAKIKIDAYPDEEFYGEVEEILPATAAKFALVPRDVSAGEFTKVAQRVPVKIRLTQGPVELLRVGLGGEVEIERR